MSVAKQLLHGGVFLIFLLAGCSSVHNDGVGIKSSGTNVDVSQQDERFCNSDIRKLIASEEKAQGIPAGILNSIAAVESQPNWMPCARAYPMPPNWRRSSLAWMSSGIRCYERFRMN